MGPKLEERVKRQREESGRMRYKKSERSAGRKDRRKVRVLISSKITK
jgi:hypothetical protein